MTILFSVLVLGALGLVFGLVLDFAGKKFHVETDERVQKVRECLGGANCGACGFAGCDAFAQAVVDGKASVNGCAPAGDKGAKAIAEIMGVEAGSSERLVARVLCQGASGVAKERYVYDGYRSCAVAAGIAGGPKECRFSCIGFGDCMAHCSFGAIHMENGLCVIDEDVCRGCGTCVATCPRGVIKLMPVTQKFIVRCRNSDVAREARRVCMHACIGCGLCKRNCPNDAITVENGFARIDPEKCVGCGKCQSVCPSQAITNASCEQ